MSISFLKTGLLTTIQDLGRNGFRRFGINPNGAMDRAAARMINILLGNPETEGILEMHFPASPILFEENAVIALGGADFAAEIDGRKIENWRAVFVKKGGVLNFPAKISGNRLYLSIRGGFQIEDWLDSHSTNLKAESGGFHGRAILKGDRVFFKQSASQPSEFSYKISRELIPYYSHFPTVRVVAGAEFDNLTAESRKKFQTQNYTIRRESDRMGFRLAGENLQLSQPRELLSSAVNFGTIQLLPDGQLIVLMADHQTTGGYPRLAHVISRDLPVAAQLGANDKMNFKIVFVEEAERLAESFERDLNFLKAACRFK